MSALRRLLRVLWIVSRYRLDTLIDADEEGAANGGAGGNEETRGRGRGNDATGTETTSNASIPPDGADETT